MSEEAEVVKERNSFIEKLIEENTLPMMEPGDVSAEVFAKRVGISEPAATAILRKQVRLGKLKEVKKRMATGNQVNVYVDAG